MANNTNQNQNQITPEQSILVLREFVNHPGVRCFNVAEYSTAFAALACLEAAIKPAPADNVIQLPPHAEKQ